MNEVEIKAMLDKLADFEAKKTVIMLDKQAIIDSILTPEIKAAIAEVEAEFADKSAGVDLNIRELQENIKAAVIAHGATVKSTFKQAVWSKPRVSWDTKKLDGYAAAHPELLTFRSEGQPTVSFRDVK